MKFQLKSEYSPTGDQPEAISQLVQGLKNGVSDQTLLGVTGSGKTFTIANVIKEINKPTLVLSHNKTLAAQLYSEFKHFFPNNAVEYFVSYYDYYQPEAYIPTTDTYIEKDLAINEDIDRLRLSATAALLSGRKDIIVVSSVSCLYGIGNPEDFTKNMIHVKVGQKIVRDVLLRNLVSAQYSRNDIQLGRANFRVKGETVDIWLSHTDIVVRIVFWDDEIESIDLIDAISFTKMESMDEYSISPANIFVTTQENVNRAIGEIEIDLGKQVEYLNSIGKPYEAKRLYERTTYDVEMMREIGYCSGIENYSRYFDGRKAGTPPFCLFDFFPKDFLLVIDESHVSIPQIKAMYGGDAARKKNLVEYGFRLPAAMDNRPLKFEEFEAKQNQTIYVSATPADYELERSEGIIVEQLIRPTGLLDPEIDVRPSKNQIDDLLEEIAVRAEKDERTIVTTLTKRMAEELDVYLKRNGIRSTYIHSDVDTLERVQILEDLRKGLYDVLIGVNLLREGIDLPQVSLVAILDADKEGFLRSHRALTQTAGRAARHINGRVIMYADNITDSMKLTIDETNRRRKIQHEYNIKHNITPQPLKPKEQFALSKETKLPINIVSEPRVQYGISKEGKKSPASNTKTTSSKKLSAADIEKIVEELKKEMATAAKSMDFITAAQLRDEIKRLEAIKSDS